MGIGLGLFLKSLVFAAGLGLVMSLYLWFVVPAEERYMRSRFGAAFDDYCRRGPGWIPNIGLLRRNEIFQRAADQGALFPSADEWPAGCCWRSGRIDVSPPRDGLADLVGRRAARFLAVKTLRQRPVVRRN